MCQIPTIVVDEQAVALGLCYSSVASLAEALRTRSGVYHSRARGLWHKGATSGATQALLGVALDCDADALRVMVRQHGPGFCHLDTRTCFGPATGLAAMVQMLQARFQTAPEGSYTKRLFTDPNLLHAKICEEAAELCEAVTPEEVAWEAADLLYFALTKCVSAGVSLSDVERHLDLRAKKISRRPGNAKPAFVKPDVKIDPSVQVKDQEGKVTAQPVGNAQPPAEDYRIRVLSHSALSQNARQDLLLRPIIDTGKIMDIVKPIVQKVRIEGDAAVRELTQKFDHVTLDSITLTAPFPPELMDVDPSVKQAIDMAYNNVKLFHEAQLDSEPLVVETMPGVTCSRFLRPIERVGLYAFKILMVDMSPAALRCFLRRL
jgi:phosphoribosyl-ATP pyrophosphohydrolase/phosphoribosyl-AMP cyclohydrolase/histidinol dehydrogenase